MLTIIAEGPTIKPALLYRSEVVGHKIAAEFVALVDNRPKHAGFGLPAETFPWCQLVLWLSETRKPSVPKVKRSIVQSFR